jgi:hypothetical protein
MTAVVRPTIVSVSEPGLSGGITPTWYAVGATAVPIALALGGRATVLVQAWEGNTLPIFLGNGSVTARVLGATPASTDGCPMLLAGLSCSISLAAAVALYARATATGQYVGTCEVAA